MPALRQAAVAGLFYPAEPIALRRLVTQELDAADTPPAPAPKLLIVPHAGYAYSGPVAAKAYALLRPDGGARPDIERVVLLGPAHRLAVRGFAAPTVQAFVTPLGTVPLDTAALAELELLPQIVRSDEPHALEHSLEVQLPFLQTLLGDGFVLVPLLVGGATAEAVAQVLDVLWGDASTLIVISSDLSHYLPYALAQNVDHATAGRILAFDSGLSSHEACGAAAINGALLAARRHGLSPRLLDLRNSGDTAGDTARVVGYGAFAFT
ncbi:AmmeMemoRadiSam system protein B [Variovorax sp. LARHSF232]